MQRPERKFQSIILPRAIHLIHFEIQLNYLLGNNDVKLNFSKFFMVVLTKLRNFILEPITIFTHNLIEFTIY